jgi:hypothetical protein
LALAGSFSYLLLPRQKSSAGCCAILRSTTWTAVRQTSDRVSSRECKHVLVVRAGDGVHFPNKVGNLWLHISSLRISYALWFLFCHVNLSVKRKSHIGPSGQFFYQVVANDVGQSGYLSSIQSQFLSYRVVQKSTRWWQWWQGWPWWQVAGTVVAVVWWQWLPCCQWWQQVANDEGGDRTVITVTTVPHRCHHCTSCHHCHHRSSHSPTRQW